MWPPINKKKYETLSYLPDLSDEQLLKEIDYLIRNGWVPCLEFETEVNIDHSVFTIVIIAHEYVNVNISCWICAARFCVP